MPPLETMRRVFQAISAVAIALTILPSALFLAGKVQLDRMKLVMLLAMIVWFVVTPLWMGREKQAGSG